MQHEEENSSRALQRLRKAKRLAEKAGESGILKFTEQVEMMLTGRGIGSLFNRIDPSDIEGSLLEVLSNMDEEELDELRDLL